jgi:3-oxoacyl-[acyl-carrier protein] reductase
LGLAIAESLSSEGVSVALAARRAEVANAHASRLPNQAVGIGVDLSTPSGPADAVNRTVAALGGLDLLVFNSGGPPSGSFADVTEQQWDTAIDGVLRAFVRLVREATPRLAESDRPSILAVLSSSVREPIPGLVTSNALRPALVGLIKTLTLEFAPIRINGIAPGKIDTARVADLDRRRALDSGTTPEEIKRRALERIPLGRYGDPRDVGRLATFLLSPAAGYITGSVVAVDGGMVRALP